MKEQLVNYTHYNVWANERVISFLKSNVSEAQLDKEIISSFPSLRKTLYHIWDAEYLWLSRLNGTSPTSGASKIFIGSTSEAYDAMLSISKAIAAHIDSKEEKYAEQTIHYSRINGTQYENVVYDMIHHCMNHSTFHRGQIIMMLRQLGFTKLFETDYIAFNRA